MPRFPGKAKTKTQSDTRAIEAHAVGPYDPDPRFPRPVHDLPFEIETVLHLGLCHSRRKEMNGADAIDHTILHKGQGLMMGDAGDHMIDRTGYLAKRFETWNAKDLLLLYADRVYRSREWKLQELPKVHISLTLRIFRDTHDCHCSRMKQAIKGMVAHL